MNGVDLVEQHLLGTLLLAPYLTEKCGAITGADFADEHRGRVFDEIKALGEFADGPLLVSQLESKRVRPPKGHGWAEMVCLMLDKYMVDDDTVSLYVQRIKEASIERRLARRFRD